MPMQSSISATLAATGQIGGPAQPGQIGPFRGFFPTFTFQPLIDLSSCGIGSKPITGGLLGLFSNGGAFNQKGNAALMRQRQTEMDALAKVNPGGVEWMQMACYGVQQVSADQVYGHGLPRGFSGIAPSHHHEHS